MNIIKEKYYYLYQGFPRPNNDPRPVVTVCLLVDDKGNFGRGVAICSPLDNMPSKKIGRAIAKSRAMKAIVKEGGVWDCYISPRRFEHVKEARDQLNYHLTQGSGAIIDSKAMFAFRAFSKKAYPNGRDLGRILTPNEQKILKADDMSWWPEG